MHHKCNHKFQERQSCNERTHDERHVFRIQKWDNHYELLPYSPT